MCRSSVISLFKQNKIDIKLLILSIYLSSSFFTQYFVLVVSGEVISFIDRIS